MAKFFDKEGGEWVLEIDYDAYKRLKRDTALDLDKLREDDSRLVEIVYGAPMELMRVMDCLLNEQVVKSGLSVEDFGKRFDPATVDRCGDALLEALLDFFHRRRAEAIRPAMKARLAEAEKKWAELALTSFVANALASSE